MGTTPVLRSASAVVSPESAPPSDDTALLEYYRDLVEPFGGVVDEEGVRAGTRVAHSDLVDHLVGPQDRERAPGLIVLTHALPDLHPFTAVAPYLNMLLGGTASSFGISQQGISAPFTALRVVSAFQRAGRCDRAVVAVLEQSTLPTPHPGVPADGLIDSGVLLEFGAGEGPGLNGVEAVGPPHSPASRLYGIAAADPEGTLLVVGPSVGAEGVADAAGCHRARSDTYCTGVWLALAQEWRSWAERYRRIVLCDTDPVSGRSHLAVFDSPARN
ncbi:hypothetical protein HDA32_005717 [Spinactinospora alkalitolerans]|uniref:Beta-ketoacyl synthase N-terminal domain-containing protein n=1 Tax=Spinactinospora alkalitolerans TaxID=687207 RepID=A0A852U4R2_9ACTN|nr:hypothetical protein [Spinactinospora alkalitolerans]NYE50597.1 hypothetical protein [Spinactinospora alkalitolerans]